MNPRGMMPQQPGNEKPKVWHGVFLPVRVGSMLLPDSAICGIGGRERRSCTRGPGSFSAVLDSRPRRW